MAPKDVPKKPKGRPTAAPKVHPYQMIRLRECMKNSARLQQLGFRTDDYDRVWVQDFAGHSDKNRSENVHPDKYQSGDSESEYDPLQDDNNEGGLIDDDNVKECSKEKTCKKTNNQTTSIPPGGFKFRSRKRVFADQTSPRVTRSKQNIAQQDASLTQSDICVPPPSQANQSHAGQLVGNLDDHRQTAIEGDNSALLDNTHMTTWADAIDRCNQHSRMDDGDGFAQHDENTFVVDVADGITQHGDDNLIANEGEKERRARRNNMGLGLQRLNRARRGKLQVVITEGNIRPVVPLVAAKYASECNIIVRNHVPILPHWKLYKKKPASSSKEKEPIEKDPNEEEDGSAYVDLFLGKLKAKFDIKIEDEVVQKACIEMMKSAVRQQRHKLKQEYFDPFPLHLVTRTSPFKHMSNKQWDQLVESWKTPKKIETCLKNKGNRGNVKYHHTTGCRAYMVHAENMGDKYNEEEADAFDLFKEFHYSKKKKCYAPTVQEAITKIENKLSTRTEGEELKSVAQVVGEVLAESTKNNKFLQNAGFKNAQPRSSEQKTKAELEAEKRENCQLRGQVADLTKKVEESEQARIMDREEMKRVQAEMQAKLDRLLSQVRPS